ncbi:MAG TPA: gamma-glutamyl-gamma-aminobutyrate hydrolase family protein [Planctomycetota bacterium]|nr:gamma-glutamyl-gamma-aminobutyrate hydrolase family protein [Planctomycetota bacterium]
MIRAKRIARKVARVAVALVLTVSGVTAWTHYGNGTKAPRIGLSLSRDWYDRSELNPAATGLALSRAGANVTHLNPGDLADLDRILDGLDGLVLVGGLDDVDPALYGGDAAAARFVERERDDFEIELLRRAERRGLPVLAICRGAQLLSVAHGGSLRPLSGRQAERHGVSARSLSAHAVALTPGTRLHAMLGPGPFPVSSTHAQGIADAGPALTVAARSDDGVIEAVELPGPRFVVGLQWHPEWEPLAGERSLAPFRALVSAASCGR